MSEARQRSFLDATTRIDTDRRYRFDEEVPEVWAALTEVDRYREWWPWLRTLDADRFAAGERWRCTVQPPLPYRLRFELTLTSVVDCDRVEAVVNGDITGSAKVTLAPIDGGSELRLTSSLAPSATVIRFVARVARPVSAWGHDWVLDTGVEQFRARGLDT